MHKREVKVPLPSLYIYQEGVPTSNPNLPYYQDSSIAGGGNYRINFDFGPLGATGQRLSKSLQNNNYSHMVRLSTVD